MATGRNASRRIALADVTAAVFERVLDVHQRFTRIVWREVDRSRSPCDETLAAFASFHERLYDYTGKGPINKGVFT